MNRYTYISLCIALVFCAVCVPAVARQKTVTLRIVQTTDVHGNFYPYNFITNSAVKGGLSCVSTYLKEQRRNYADRLLYVDNGDLLQGQPCAYYYNYIDTVAQHLAAQMLNYLGCNVSTMGNHDVETGHAVYDRWTAQCNFPVLGANIVRTDNGKPYLPPYIILKRQGVRVAVLGLITPNIPAWLPQNLWSGLCFDDMVDCASRWMKVIREKEHPDVVIGLFHSGFNNDTPNKHKAENASLDVARQVPGFDAVFIGHDHQRHLQQVMNVAGDTVRVIDAASGAHVLGQLDITLTFNGQKVVAKSFSSSLVSMDSLTPDPEFMHQFAPQMEAVKQFVGQKIGRFERSVCSSCAFFGSSGYMDLIHQLQLQIGKADISFAAPLSMNSTIAKGDVYVRDMFSLYKFENMLYTMRLTGKEVKDYLEMSYALWTNTMTSPNDHVMLLAETKDDNQRSGFKNFTFNFDSAAGIIYTVDVTKPQGNKVHIISMADGTPFKMDKDYRVAINSYRGNGGGSLLTEGAGIPQNELQKRVLQATDKDLRYYMMEAIRQQGTINPVNLNQWRFIPEQWTGPALECDRKLLFGN